jgi:hypothetical protein
MNDFRPFDKDLDDPISKLAQKIMAPARIEREKTAKDLHEAAIRRRIESAEKRDKKILESIDELLNESPTRKDFKVAANIVKSIKTPKVRQHFADKFATMYSKQNPRFSHEKWHAWIGTKNNTIKEPTK